MISSVVSNLRVHVPPPTGAVPLPKGIPLVNANPQCGPFPFSDIRFATTLDNGPMVFEARVSHDFIGAQVLPRGRPHLSLLHVALFDDGIAVATMTAAGERYGETHRYIELDVAVAFHREAFVRGSVETLQFGTIEVDSFLVRWQGLPLRQSIPVVQRGVFQVSILSLAGEEEVPLASVEGRYMRRRGVLNVT